MLKVFLGCMVSVVVLLSSAYAPMSRAYAASATVVIAQIQAGGVGAATQEFIVVYNNSSNEVAITGWCLTNKSGAVITCFSPPVLDQAIYLPAHRYAVVASAAFAISLPVGTVKTTYAPTNQSSGSITGGSDTISLIDRSGTVIDRHSWTASLSAGMQYERHSAGLPPLYQDTDTAEDWAVTIPGRLPIDETEIDANTVDVCPNIDGAQGVIPPGDELSQAGECVARTIIQLNITEVFPNPAGNDEGQEFIELFNPNVQVVDLSDYELYIGPQYEKPYSFPDGSMIQPGSYRSFSNAEIPFSLLNSSSGVRLALRDGTVVSEAPAYLNPKDGQSWININEEWVYTSHPTPGLENIPMINTVTESVPESTQQPCAVNQYRSPDTNRCRLLVSIDSTVIPCKEGQYRSEETNRCRSSSVDTKTVTQCKDGEERNPDTNRCRKAVAPSGPTPCKEGQERNLDTNRCRTVVKMPSVGYGVLGAETKRTGNWYMWAAVAGIVALASGYGIWEWHDELGKFTRKVSSRFVRLVRFRK